MIINGDINQSVQHSKSDPIIAGSRTYIGPIYYDSQQPVTFTLTVAFTDLQGSFNYLTGTIQQSLTTPPVTALTLATSLAQEVDDGLTQKQMLALITKFIATPAKADAYSNWVKDFNRSGLTMSWGYLARQPSLIMRWIIRWDEHVSIASLRSYFVTVVMNIIS